MTSNHFKKLLTEKGSLKVKNYYFVLQDDKVLVFYNGEIDPFILDNGSLTIPETFFVCRRVLGDGLHDEKKVRTNSNIYFGSMRGWSY